MTEQNPPRVPAVSESKSRARAGGRPEYKPTEEQRVAVRKLVIEGKRREEIATAIGVSRATLRKHFAAELVKPALADQAAELPLQASPPANVVRQDVAGIGRPEFEPSYRQREDVQLWKADGWSHDRIARRLRISPTTLAKHFAEELSDGADAVRALALRNLRNASNKGSVPASNALLKLSGLEPPPPPPPKDAPDAEPPAADQKLGKKELARREALTAEQGTSWHDYMSDDVQVN